MSLRPWRPHLRCGTRPRKQSNRLAALHQQTGPYRLDDLAASFRGYKSQAPQAGIHSPKVGDANPLVHVNRESHRPSARSESKQGFTADDADIQIYQDSACTPPCPTSGQPYFPLRIAHGSPVRSRPAQGRQGAYDWNPAIATCVMRHAAAMVSRPRRQRTWPLACATCAGIQVRYSRHVSETVSIRFQCAAYELQSRWLAVDHVPVEVMDRNRSIASSLVRSA